MSDDGLRDIGARCLEENHIEKLDKFMERVKYVISFTSPINTSWSTDRDWDVISRKQLFKNLETLEENMKR